MTAWDKSRQIVRRIVVTGELLLTAPAHLGSGETAGVVDMLLLRDAVEGRPLLPGTSLAGALRGHLLARAAGYGVHEAERHGVAKLFGGTKGDDDGAQSPLIIDDALAIAGPAEVRDGVKIDPARRTALDSAKYDVELLPAGTRFPLRFELLLSKSESEASRATALLARALAALEEGEIQLGARRSRGYGACRVEGWRAVAYDLTTVDGLLAWVSADHGWAQLPAEAVREGTAAAILGAEPADRDRRHRFVVELVCAIDGALLIRSDALLGAGRQPDFVHLRNQDGYPVISGTSLAGALRARALRIAEQVRPGQGLAIVDRLFGRDLHAARNEPTMSRLVVGEAIIEEGRTVVQSRVSIDRFTGGALDTALFSEAPQFGGRVNLRIELRSPEPGEVGLLLLLLKDLWTGDLTIGGEASVGRGRLRGLHATLALHSTDAPPALWTLSQDSAGLNVTGDRSALEGYVTALSSKEMRHGAA